MELIQTRVLSEILKQTKLKQTFGDFFGESIITGELECCALTACYLETHQELRQRFLEGTIMNFRSSLTEDGIYYSLKKFFPQLNDRILDSSFQKKLEQLKLHMNQKMLEKINSVIHEFNMPGNLYGFTTILNDYCRFSFAEIAYILENLGY